MEKQEVSALYRFQEEPTPVERAAWTAFSAGFNVSERDLRIFVAGMRIQHTVTTAVATVEDEAKRRYPAMYDNDIPGYLGAVGGVMLGKPYDVCINNSTEEKTESKVWTESTVWLAFLLGFILVVFVLTWLLEKN